MIYGYARCSTELKEGKQDVAYQVRELKKLGVTDKDNIYIEYESGMKVDRKELNRLLSVVSKGDTIVATEVSRITRSTKQLCDIIELVKQKNIKLVIGKSMTIDCSNGELDPMTAAFLQMTGVFSELERNMIRQRVILGMNNAKAKGKKIGRPVVDKDSIPGVFYKHYPLFKNKTLSLSEFAKLCDMSRTTIYKYLKIVEA
ncbi:recombinase family protein [Clostridium beijerinckii]|uniref:recombinase family protein n=1 Tax=Clostridium beijerinckii TaxID=1520 RepID=UPI00047BB348|nr:recombinase family protein [Clostridium beijerinckii]